MMGVFSPMTGSWSDRIGIRPLTITGLIVMAGSYFGFLTLDLDMTVPHFVALAVPLGLGLAIFQSPNNSAIMGSVPREYMGVGSGLLHITRLLGQVSGIAVLGSVWAANVARVSGGALPDGGASAAPVAFQIEGLRTTFLIAALVMTTSLAVGVWGLRFEKRATPAMAADT